MNANEIYRKALKISNKTARHRFLKSACQGNPQLEIQVQTLLLASTNDLDPVSTPPKEELSLLETQQFDRRQLSQTEIDFSLVSLPDDDAFGEFRQFLSPSLRDQGLGRLGHFEIESVLGRGAFGVVLKAFDEKLHRTVAIKMLKAQFAVTEPTRERFIREARTAAAVAHDNLVSVFSIEDSPFPYIVMEYVPGETLQDHLSTNGRMDVKEILNISLQIALGLAEAHKHNLIHRDIKPANLLLLNEKPGRVKISDFGLARAVDDVSMTASGAIAGTPLYMSPEQARGEKLDHRSDLFSLGTVMYEMATGERPFQANNSVSVLRLVCEYNPFDKQGTAPTIPPLLSHIIEGLMNKRPEDRFQSADDVVSYLKSCIQQDLSSNREIETSFVSSNSIRWYVSLALTLLIGAIISCIALFMMDQGDSKTNQQTDATVVLEPTPVPEKKDSETVLQFLSQVDSKFDSGWQPFLEQALWTNSTGAQQQGKTIRLTATQENNAARLETKVLSKTRLIRGEVRLLSGTGDYGHAGGRFLMGSTDNSLGLFVTKNRTAVAVYAPNRDYFEEVDFAKTDLVDNIGKWKPFEFGIADGKLTAAIGSKSMHYQTKEPINKAGPFLLLAWNADAEYRNVEIRYFDQISTSKHFSKQILASGGRIRFKDHEDYVEDVEELETLEDQKVIELDLSGCSEQLGWGLLLTALGEELELVSMPDQNSVKASDVPKLSSRLPNCRFVTNNGTYLNGTLIDALKSGD